MRFPWLFCVFLVSWALSDDQPVAAQAGIPSKIPPAQPTTARRPVQPPRPWFIYGGVAVPTIVPSFSNTVTFTEFVEQGTREVDYEVQRVVAFDGGFGMGLRRRGTLFLGGSVSYSNGSANGIIDAQLPHPFYFNQPRTLEAEVPDLKRTELAVHLQVAKRIGLSRQSYIMLSAGPSLFWLDQEIVTDIAYTQEFPFDEVSFDEALTEIQSRTSFGFNAQGNFVYSLAGRTGIDGFVRYSYAPIRFEASDSTEFKSSAGGLQVGVALRASF